MAWKLFIFFIIKTYWINIGSRGQQSLCRPKKSYDLNGRCAWNRLTQGNFHTFSETILQGWKICRLLELGHVEMSTTVDSTIGMFHTVDVHHCIYGKVIGSIDFCDGTNVEPLCHNSNQYFHKISRLMLSKMHSKKWLVKQPSW